MVDQLSPAKDPGTRFHPLRALKHATARVLGRESAAYLDLYHRVVRRPTFPSIGHLVHRFAYDRRDREVRFAQIGANEGSSEDVLYYPIHRFGWRGVLVEPQDREYDRLRYNYRGLAGVSCEHAAVVAPGLPAPLLHYVVPAAGIPQWASKLSSFDPAIPAQVRAYYPQARIASRPVRTLTLDDLLQKHDLQGLDVLLTDTEGYDYEILRHVDWDRLAPSLVIYEHRHLSPANRVELVEILAAKGYATFTGTYDTAAFREPTLIELYSGTPPPNGVCAGD